MIPIVVQNFYNKKILIQTWGTIETIKKTYKYGISYFFSRKKKRIWIKGEQSSDIQLIKKIIIDCDYDSLIYLVIQINKSCCHLKYKSCFKIEYD
ncbi:phosphoribosyl-AMP cyclohydrolase [Candidatus Vidania fulgoroideorum]